MTEKFFTRLLLLILFVSLSIWFGGSLVRSAIGYELFYNGEKLEIKTEYSNEIQLHTIKLFAYASPYTGIAYIASFLSIIILTFKWRKILKQNGWLFMAIVLFLLSSPIEIYLTFLDFQLNQLVLNGGLKSFGDINIQHLFTDRYTKFSLFTPITSLSLITSMVFMIWKPLKLENNK